MAADTSWASLPSIIIVEILSYLTLKDRLSAVSSCKRWRDCLWHPLLWPRITFKLSRDGSSRSRSKHLAENCGRFIREANIDFSSKTSWDVKECAQLLGILAENRNLLKLSLKPSNCHIEWPERNTQNVLETFHGSIENIIKNSRRLKHVSFGCLEEIVSYSDYVLDLLAEYQSHSLQSLHIASIKEDPDSYSLCDLDYGHFQALANLKYLSIDYDYLTNELLEAFMRDHHVGLEKLIVNVHGIQPTPTRNKISNRTWWRSVRYSPKLRVTLNLIHSIDGVHHLLDILQPSMPLAHLRMLFCSEINIPAIDFIAQHNSSTFETLHVIDGFVKGRANVYETNADEDPFVMLAWKCPLLTKLTMIGYDFAEDDLVAIARLRGPKLSTFELAESCISTMIEQEDSDVWVQVGQISQQARDEISKSLGRNWRPLPDSMLHSAVKDSHADADTAYMKLLLKDQEFY
ncbi:F-box only protein 33-like [Tubulanus polymorphus]|uniref:F-box only protein 33-like n=1 Tax=Tubulanus polymorphus TaxID=672921 RepID=UPI003DA57497